MRTRSASCRKSAGHSGLYSSNRMEALCSRSPPILAACISSSVATIHLYTSLTWPDTQCSILDESLLFMQRCGVNLGQGPTDIYPPKVWCCYWHSRKPAGQEGRCGCLGVSNGQGARSVRRAQNRPGAKASHPHRQKRNQAALPLL